MKNIHASPIDAFSPVEIRPMGTGMIGLGLHILVFAALSVLCLQALLGVAPGEVIVQIPWIFATLPLLVLIFPRSLAHLLILFLPLQQILFCIAYTWNPEWSEPMKWLLGWKDACLIVGLAAAAFQYQGRLFRPGTGWEWAVFLYTAIMILMLPRPGFPLMQKIASLRFNIAPFFFLLAGYHLRLGPQGARSALRLFWFMTALVIGYGFFETFFLSDDFYLEHIHIAAFKSGAYETGTDPHIGSYLYAPGFLHQRRMVSVFLSATATGHFLSFVLCLLLALGASSAGFRSRIAHGGLVLLISVGIFMTASRLAMLEALGVGIAFTLLSDMNRRLRYLIIGLFIIGSVFLLHGNTLMHVADNTLSAKDPSTVKHIQSIVSTPLTPLGTGLGEAANVFADRSRYSGGEGIFNRIVLETGIFGFLAFALTYGVIGLCAGRAGFRSPKTQAKTIGRAICLSGAVYLPVMIPSVFITVNLFSAVSHGIFWLILGIGFNLSGPPNPPAAEMERRTP